MPGRKINLFIQSCLQNNGRLFARKRAGHFDFLPDKAVTRMEAAIRSAFRGNGDGKEP